MKKTMIWLCCLQFKEKILRLTWTVMHQMIWMNLPRCLLNSTCDPSLLDERNKQKSVQRTQPPNKKLRKSAAKNWKKDTDLQRTLKLSEASAVPEEWKEIIKLPIGAFKSMFSDDLALHMTNQLLCSATW